MSFLATILFKTCRCRLPSRMASDHRFKFPHGVFLANFLCGAFCPVHLPAYILFFIQPDTRNTKRGLKDLFCILHIFNRDNFYSHSRFYSASANIHTSNHCRWNRSPEPRRLCTVLRSHLIHRTLSLFSKPDIPCLRSLSLWDKTRNCLRLSDNFYLHNRFCCTLESIHTSK